MRLVISLIILLSSAAALGALEGAYTSSHKDWKNVKPQKVLSQSERAAELKQRAEDIQAHIDYLKARLQTVPSKAKMGELHKALRAVYKQYGWEPRSQLVYGRRSMDPMLKNQNTMPKNLLAAFKQLNEDLKARGIDLIVLPLAPTPHFHAHTLVDGIGPDHEYFPGFTQMMIELMEHDIEVVDSITEFRHEAENKTLVSWANDFHTGSLGRQLAARKLAERLQRYDFARKLKGNANKWKIGKHTHTGAMFPQRITMVNNGFKGVRKKDFKGGQPFWPAKHPAKVFVLQPDFPSEAVDALKNLKFDILKLKRPQDKRLLRTELVMFGDSQLHSAVYGTGLPEFINMEVGGIFRWGSKSWKGFSPPEIFLDIVPANAVQPRVAVMTFLPKYFWHVYDRSGKIDEKKNKYTPRPLPPFTGKPVVAAASGPITAKVRVMKVSRKPTNDPSTLEYDDALMHIAVKIQDGPMKGQEIGLRYWILNDGQWTKADKRVRVGQSMKLTMDPWSQVIAKDSTLGQHQIFDDTNQPLTVPIYWITGGKLSPAALLK